MRVGNRGCGRIGGVLFLLLVSGISGPVVALDFVDRLQKAEQSLNAEPREALRIAEDVLAAAESAGDRPARAEALRLLGIARNITGSNDQALQALQESLALFEAEGNRVRQTLVLRHLGVVHFDAGRSDQALEHYLRALAGFEALDDAVEIAKTRANIANVHLRTGRIAEAVEQHRAALARFEQVGAAMPMAATHLNLGAALRALAEQPDTDPAQRSAGYVEARASFERASRIFRGLDIARGVLKAEANLAAVQAAQGELEPAAEAFAGVLRLARELGDVQEEVLALKRLLAVQHQRGQWEEARSSAAAGLALAERLQDSGAQESFHRSLSELQEVGGDTARALFHAREAERIARQLAQSEQGLRVAEISRRYENAQRDRELEALKQAAALDQAELGKQRVLRNAAVVIGLLALGMLLLYGSRYRLRERSRLELQRAAETDPLTGLLNRRGLRQWVGTGAPGTAYAVLIGDVDHFKRINDELGHDVGDAVLIEVARRLRQAIRPDDEAARWGGEEFLIVLPGADSAAAMQVGERLRECVASSPIGDAALTVTLSLGVAVVLPEQGFDAVVQAADQALLQAKRTGRNRVLFAPPRLRAIPAATVEAG